MKSDVPIQTNCCFPPLPDGSGFSPQLAGPGACPGAAPADIRSPDCAVSHTLPLGSLQLLGKQRTQCEQDQMAASRSRPSRPQPPPASSCVCPSVCLSDKVQGHKAAISDHRLHLSLTSNLRWLDLPPELHSEHRGVARRPHKHPLDARPADLGSALRTSMESFPGILVQDQCN